ncbi:hypothetical protein [Streptomyces sp. NPDC052015]|uniref:nucleoside-diphosphate sugar epimerase/dehydratase n=1 Tax=Streptomyces sp. NPDC052015 TaxID=3154755 RepID=UPI0034277694
MSWCALAAMVAALFPAHALSVRTLLTGCVLQPVASWAGRGAVHWHRRRTLARRPAAALVVGPAATSPRVAAAFLRHPGCGLRPVGVLSDGGAGGAGLPVLSTEEAQRAVIQNNVGPCSWWALPTNTPRCCGSWLRLAACPGRSTRM